jgi:emp24/gp25L/p24 family/GOLD
VYSVEKLNSLVSAARVDLEAFKAREHIHRKSAWTLLPAEHDYSVFSFREKRQYLLTVLLSFVSSTRCVQLEAAERNRRRVTFWALLECLLIVAVAAVQVMRIKNFFEYKRSM